MIQMIDALADHGLAQYGILGAVFAAVFAGMTIPMLRALISQNAQAIELLRKAVETNTAAVATFTRLEVDFREGRAEARTLADAMENRLAEQSALLQRLAAGQKV